MSGIVVHFELTKAGIAKGGDVDQEITLFIGTFATLLAIINPFEPMPVFLFTPPLLQCRREGETEAKSLPNPCNSYLKQVTLKSSLLSTA